MARWTWAAASRRGTSHRDANTRRQDAFRVVDPGDDDFLVVVACDGAGSAERGGEGASIAAWTLSSCARSWLASERRLPDAERISMWTTLARLHIANAACDRWLDLREFATTVVMAVSDGDSTAVISVGDGAVVARDATSCDWVTLSWPENGEFASTTYFLTDEDLRLRVSFHSLPIDRLVVMTDGLEHLALDFAIGTPHRPFCDAVSAPVAIAADAGRNDGLSRQLGEYLDSNRINARTDDDKTLIVAARV